MPPAFDLSETNASHLYRIAQEALTNAARHGRSTLVDISLVAEDEGFRLRITDNGVGFSRAAPSAPGMGLKIMKYRADMIGAKFDIGANEPCGATVTITGQRAVRDTLHYGQAIPGEGKHGSQQHMDSIVDAGLGSQSR